jgi:hypothetical protein
VRLRVSHVSLVAQRHDGQNIQSLKGQGLI